VTISALIAGVLLFSACGKKPVTSAEPPPSAASKAAGQPPPERSAGTLAPQEDVSGVLSGLTQVVRKYAAEQRRVPKTLDELVAAGYLPSLPAAPAGNKFVIDKNLAVQLVAR
jgi:hypothetical protein